MTSIRETEGLIEQAAPESTSSYKRLPFNLSAVIIQIGFVIFAVIVGIQLLQRSATQPTEGPAPDFELTTFAGDTFRLSDLRGNIVVVNFWASWCEPCRDEAPILQSAWENYRDEGVIFVGIAYADATQKSLDFIEEFGISYPNGPDIGTVISEEYRITGVPETFIVDREGNIFTAIIAPIVPGQLEAVLDEILYNAE